MHVKTLIISILALMGVCALLFLCLPDSAPPPSLPSPNAYDDFVRAGKMVANDTPYLSDMTLEQLTGYVQTNKPAVKLLREGLRKPCRVTTHYATNMSQHSSEIMAIKRGVRALHAEERLAEKENRVHDAAEICLEMMDYGCASGNGGVFIDKLVSRACELYGVHDLAPLLARVESKEFCIRAIQRVEKLNAQRENWDTMLRNEMRWQRSARAPLHERLSDLMSGKSQKAKRLFREDMRVLEQQSRQLMVVLAARAYELDHGRAATNYEELVPTYLSAVPVVSISGREIPFSLEIQKNSDFPRSHPGF